MLKLLLFKMSFKTEVIKQHKIGKEMNVTYAIGLHKSFHDKYHAYAIRYYKNYYRITPVLHLGQYSSY